MWRIDFQVWHHVSFERSPILQWLQIPMVHLHRLSIWPGATLGYNPSVIGYFHTAHWLTHPFAGVYALACIRGVNSFCCGSLVAEVNASRWFGWIGDIARAECCLVWPEAIRSACAVRNRYLIRLRYSRVVWSCSSSLLTWPIGADGTQFTFLHVRAQMLWHLKTKSLIILDCKVLCDGIKIAIEILKYLICTLAFCCHNKTIWRLNIECWNN